jgi:hypothetical protein
LSGATFRVENGLVRLTGWFDTGELPGQYVERRIVLRVVMPVAVARRLCAQLAKIV